MEDVQKPQAWHMTVTRGDRWPALDFTIDDAVGTDINPTNVTMRIRRLSSSVPVKTLAVGSGFTLVGNKVTFATEVDLPVGDYLHSIEITLQSGALFTVFDGVVSVVPD
jgi:hypothetical protein